MREKKSLTEAIERAQHISSEHPNEIYRVMDKPGKRAVVIGSDWIYKELILEHWHTYCAYQNGEKL